MFHYWYRVLSLLLFRKLYGKLDPEVVLTRTFRVRLFDTDGFRVMTAFKYAAYMDLIRWELIARSKLYQAIIQNGLAPVLGSQKIVYRKPLRVFTKFTLELETAGWDDKWIYHVHRFKQGGETKAIGITKALIWKRDKPHILHDILVQAGAKDLDNPPPEWVAALFTDDTEMLTR